MSSNVNTTSLTFPVEIAVRRICAQHRNLARVLRELEAHAEAITDGKSAPDPILIAAVLRYIDGFSHGIHQRAEETYLFSAIRRRGAPDYMVDSAMGAHNLGARKLAALQAVFEAWRNRSTLSTSPFLELLPDHISFEFDHMSYEENVVLPYAIDTLPANDWVQIADVFRAHEDPLFRIDPAPEFAPLHHLPLGRLVSH